MGQGNIKYASLCLSLAMTDKTKLVLFTQQGRKKQSSVGVFHDTTEQRIHNAHISASVFLPSAGHLLWHSQ
jgi:hypothetical protein